MAVNLKNKNFLTLMDFTPEEIRYLLDLSHELKRKKKEGIRGRTLIGKNVVLLFDKPSTRTRSAFEVACLDEGGNITFKDERTSQVNRKESLEDTAKILGRYYDAIGYRGFSQKSVEDLANYSQIPVWNGLTDVDHPTQILADIMTVEEEIDKPLDQIKVVFCGDVRNNMSYAWMYGCAKMGMHFVACAPKSLWPSADLINKCAEIATETGAILEFSEKPLEATKEADVLYSDVWVSMGEPKEVWKERIELLHPYQINNKLMNNAKESVIFMHCLPAFHGINTDLGKEIASEFGNLYKEVKNGEMEVTDEVFESLQSVVFDEAENRMHTIKAVILSTLGK